MKLLAVLLAIIGLISMPAMANAGSAYLVVDARTGAVLGADNADTLNHPASLTKMMTLYMTFEALHRGKLRWDSQVPFSRTAAAKPPTKLGVKAGSAVSVKEAVLGMIVQSANDAAAAMAEKLGGSEEAFAAMMTAKARRLGMRQTVFTNASGLPDARQVTTARDMSILGMALLRDYPGEYRLFSASSFVFRGRTIRGHNNLMYRYEGMDGIKTGYTNASGFNLVSAVRQGNRRLIGVVMGGRTARSRDAQMAALMDRYLGGESAGTQLAARPSTQKTVEVASASQASDAPIPFATPQRDNDNSVAAIIAMSPGNAIQPGDRPTMLIEPRTPQPAANTGWAVQISAAPTAEAAMAILAQAQADAGKPLRKASPYTEPVGEGQNMIYRARFTGFKSREAAVSACDALRKRSYDCVLLPGQG